MNLSLHTLEIIEPIPLADILLIFPLSARLLENAVGPGLGLVPHI